MVVPQIARRGCGGRLRTLRRWTRERVRSRPPKDDPRKAAGECTRLSSPRCGPRRSSGLLLTVPSASETTALHDETLCALLLPYFKMLIAYDQEPAQACCQLHADARRGHPVEELAPGRPAINGSREFESVRPRRRQDRLHHVAAAGHWAPGCMPPAAAARCPHNCPHNCPHMLPQTRPCPRPCPRPSQRPLPTPAHTPAQRRQGQQERWAAAARAARGC